MLKEMEMTELRVDKKTKKRIPRRILVKDSAKKTVVLGFTVTVNSLIDIAWELLNDKEEPMERVYTYAFVQDFIEHMFSIIRKHCGWKNAPSTPLLKYIVRKLIVMKSGGLHPSLFSNCSYLLIDFELDEEDSLPGGFAAIEVEMDEATEEYVDYLNKAENQPLQLVRLKDFKNRILGYIAGYLCLKLSPRIQCSKCKKALENSVDDPLDPKLAQLINQKKQMQTFA